MNIGAISETWPDIGILEFDIAPISGQVPEKNMCFLYIASISRQCIMANITNLVFLCVMLLSIIIKWCHKSI